MLVCWVGILAESGNERIARPVETIEEPLVERKAGAENRADHQGLIWQGHGSDA